MNNFSLNCRTFPTSPEHLITVFLERLLCNIKDKDIKE